MVDDHRGRQRREEVDEFGQVGRLEIDHDMPVMLDNAAGDLDQFVLRREVDQPLDEIEPDAAHTGLVKPLQFRVAHLAPDGRDAARLAPARTQGVDHGAVVGAVAGRLHDHVAGKAEMIA